MGLLFGNNIFYYNFFLNLRYKQFIVNINQAKTFE